MKKFLLSIFLIFFLAAQSFAAGSCVQTASAKESGVFLVTLACTGDAANGSIPNTALSSAIMAKVSGTHYLYTVAAYPTSGGTAPDAADVFILDANGEDLLGSVDAGTTAKNGLNLIHATLKKTTFPYSTFLQQAYFPAITNTLTLKVLNQATNSANYTIELVFSR